MRLRKKKDTAAWLEQCPIVIRGDGRDVRGRWRDIFGNDHPIHVELGVGKGRFISELSARNPDINFVGIDLYDELIRRTGEKAYKFHREFGRLPEGYAQQTDNAAQLPEAPLPNLRLIRFDVRNIEEIFAEGEIERIYLNFSDPWPKKRHARRRLTHPDFVRKYVRILNENGEIHMKTDSRLLFEFSLNTFADMELKMRNISLDVHRDGTPPDYVFTEYEQKFVELGDPIYAMEIVIGRNALQKARQEQAGLYN